MLNAREKVFESTKQVKTLTCPLGTLSSWSGCWLPAVVGTIAPLASPTNLHPRRDWPDLACRRLVRFLIGLDNKTPNIWSGKRGKSKERSIISCSCWYCHFTTIRDNFHGLCPLPTRWRLFIIISRESKWGTLKSAGTRDAQFLQKFTRFALIAVTSARPRVCKCPPPQIPVSQSPF